MLGFKEVSFGYIRLESVGYPFGDVGDAQIVVEQEGVGVGAVGVGDGESEQTVFVFGVLCQHALEDLVFWELAHEEIVKVYLSMNGFSSR